MQQLISFKHTAVQTTVFTFYVHSITSSSVLWIWENPYQWILILHTLQSGGRIFPLLQTVRFLSHNGCKTKRSYPSHFPLIKYKSNNFYRPDRKRNVVKLRKQKMDVWCGKNYVENCPIKFYLILNDILKTITW